MSRILIVLSLLGLLFSSVLETAASVSTQHAPQASAQEARGGHVDAEKKGKHKKKHKNKNKKKRKDQDQDQNPGEDETCFEEKVTIRAVGTSFVEGTADADVIIGDAAGNKVIGNGGFDNICVGSGDDLVAGSVSGAGTDPMNVDGGAGDDELKGEGSDDLLLGGDGNDRISGHDGSDNLNGGPGDDLIFALPDEENPQPEGIDSVQGGDGDDTIRTDDSIPDRVDCGPGNDTVTFDPIIDEISNCEIENPDSAR